MNARLEIISLAGPVFLGEIQLLVVTGVCGEIGILPRHAPFLSLIRSGPIRFTLASGGESYFFISQGILDVRANQIIILADTVIEAKDQAAVNEMRKQEIINRQNAKKVKQQNLTELLIQITNTTTKLRATHLSTSNDPLKRF